MEPCKALTDLRVPKSPYSLENCFDRRALQLPDGRRKAQLFAALIPAGCRTVLDVGGGTGWATIGIREKCSVVTLDNCAESLSHAPGATILANVEALPCADRSFDLVISSQVLEHLRGDVLGRACSEMMRVGKNHLLVSVPYREALETRHVRCGFCQHVFHPDYHCHSFTEESLAKLFPQWLMAEWHVFGALRRGSGVIASRRRQRARDILPAFVGTICPKCGNQVHETPCHRSASKESILHRVLAASRMRLGRYLVFPDSGRYSTFLPQAVAPFWIAALFTREESSSPIDGDLTFYRPGLSKFGGALDPG